MKPKANTERSLAPGFTRAQALANTERVFEEAFGSSSGSPEEHAMVDRVEYAPEGLRISYSRPTAEWLTSVTERPEDFGLVYNFLVEEILGRASHPLGRVADEFASLMSLFSPDDGGDGWDESEESASPDTADERTPLAAQCMKIGVTRLHGLVSAVLPQLQHNPGRSFALAAVEAVLFDRCSAVLSTLLGGASGEDDSRCEFLELEALLPRHLGVRQAFWLEAEEAETPRGRTPRGRTPRGRTPRRGAAGGGDAEQGQEGLGQDIDEQLPYAQAIALVQALPLLAAPRQKLQLFCDACTEAQRCVARHHEGAEARRREAQPQQHAHAAPAAAEAEAGAVGRAPAAVAVGPEATALGAEDLIPVMAYVLLRAKLCHLDAQLRLIEVFVDDPAWQAALLGPLGYGLATLHAATQLLLSFCRTARGDATPATPATPAPPAASPRGATGHRAGYHRIGAPLAPASSPANGAARFGSPGCDKRSSPSLRERARLAKRSLCSGGGAAAASIVGALVTEPAHLGALRAHLGASRGSKGAPDARLPAGRAEAAVPAHSTSGDDDDASGQGAASSGARSAAHLGGAAAVAALRAGRLSAARKLGPEERQSPSILASPAPRTPVPRIWGRARASPGGVPTPSGGNSVTAAAPATSVAAIPAAAQLLPTAGPGLDLPDAPDAPAPTTPKGARPRVGVLDGTRAAYSLSLPVAVMLPAAEDTPPASERGSLTRRGGGRRRQYYDASNNPEMGCVTCRDAGDAETENQSPSTMASMLGARLPPHVPATAAEISARVGERPTSAGTEGDGPRHTPCKPRRKQYIGDQTPNAEDQTRRSPTP